MSSGLATTFRVLSTTDNEAAASVLFPALDSPYQDIQDGALESLLGRRNPAAQTEILRRFSSLNTRWKLIINRYPGRLTSAFRDAVLGKDDSLFQNACQAAVMFHDFNLIPTLLTALENAPRDKAELTIETLMQLSDLLYEELIHPNENSVRRDPQLIRKYVVSCLETSVQRFANHKRSEVVEALLILAEHDNPVLAQALGNPHHVNFLVIIDVMAKSQRDGVIKLLLSYLDDPQMHSSVLSVMANRADMKFIRQLLRKIGAEAGPPINANLKRMETIAWLRNTESIIAQLDDGDQQGMVRLVMGANIPQDRAFSVVKYILLNGKRAGRRAAALALDSFNGAEANALVMHLLNDPDPRVQANILQNVRRRGIPGLLSQLTKMLESPHLEVRQAARKCLSDISFARFLTTFDLLDENDRKASADLVKKVDPQTIPLLRAELQAPLSPRQMRALQIVRIMDAAEDLTDELIELLQDEDRTLRAEAASILENCNSPKVRAILEESLHDRRQIVREAVEECLRKYGSRTMQNNAHSDSNNS